MNNKNALKLKLIQLRKLKMPSFITCIDGDFTQKFAQTAQKTGEQTINNVNQELKSRNWKLIPRGKVAVRMSFHAKNGQVPLVHNLVKYYMDLLNGLLFADDRQVHYLETHCYGSDKKDSKLYLEVERLATYKKRLQLYYEFRDKFDDSYEPSEINTELFPLLSKEQLQHMVLENCGIEDFDQPGDFIAKRFGNFIRKFQKLHPYIIDLGDLPYKSGESKGYKQRIRDTLKALTVSSNTFNPIVIPVELDVQVTPRALKLGKDLDNIMIDICKPFSEEVLGEGGYLNGFRIYVTDRLVSDITDSIKIKLLPFNAIYDFRDTIRKVSDKTEKYLEHKLSY